MLTLADKVVVERRFDWESSRVTLDTLMRAAALQVHKETGKRWVRVNDTGTGKGVDEFYEEVPESLRELMEEAPGTVHRYSREGGF